MAVLPVAARCADFAQIDFRIEVGCKSVAVIAAVTVENINGVNLVKFVLCSVCAIRLRHARIKAAAEQCSQAGILKFLSICPLPRVIKVCRKSFFFTALFINCTPFRIIGVLRLIVCRVHIVDAASQASIHNGQILIRQCNIHNQVRLVRTNQINDLLYIICVNLCGCHDGLGLACQFLCQCITLGLGTAGNAQFGKYIADLTALLDCNTGYAAAADYENSTHIMYSFF